MLCVGRSISTTKRRSVDSVGPHLLMVPTIVGTDEAIAAPSVPRRRLGVVEGPPRDESNPPRNISSEGRASVLL